MAASSIPNGLRFTVDPRAQGQASASLAGEVNEMRRQQGLPLLRSLGELDRIAAARAADMARNGYFSHYDARGETVIKRVRESGLSSCRTSENIAFGQDTPLQTAIEWMRSPGHRKAMLDSKVDYIGTARAVAQGRAYWVAVFSRLC
ncbi:CAP domain-containing protein [Pseudooceanicola nanhaiensis]|uniref:CAP domain-containing protein n=1 Tax=Pseudooceanicola nanhaiensis TaxID=375761 RepID=UPI001CD3F0C1|nr:CAP domain-containing protein [Pseudooceanicola nanhaiensis]MCA0918981.1 CAP domain-containing protein [Pseudooceanicola nanhaiensis]